MAWNIYRKLQKENEKQLLPARKKSSFLAWLSSGIWKLAKESWMGRQGGYLLNKKAAPENLLACCIIILSCSCLHTLSVSLLAAPLGGWRAGGGVAYLLLLPAISASSPLSLLLSPARDSVWPLFRHSCISSLSLREIYPEATRHSKLTEMYIPKCLSISNEKKMKKKEKRKREKILLSVTKKKGLYSHCW